MKTINITTSVIGGSILVATLALASDASIGQLTATSAIKDIFIGGLLAIIGGGIWYSLRQISVSLDKQKVDIGDLYDKWERLTELAIKRETQCSMAMELSKCPALVFASVNSMSQTKEPKNA